MRRSELVRRLAAVPEPAPGNPALEQVATPPEAAAELLLAALADGNLESRSVVDLGSGTGRLAIGAALLGARPVVGVEIDPALAEVARRSASRLGVDATFRPLDVADWTGREEVVVMNPPFGAQRRHADRPFWTAALAVADRMVYSFALAAGRPFVIARLAEAGARVEWTRAVPWALPRVFPHHTRARVPLDVDLWAVRA